MQKHTRQMRLRQGAPPLFVAALLLGLLLVPILPVAVYVLTFIAGAYSFAVIAASILSARRCGWYLLPLLPIAFAILHLAYGAGFLVGLLKFWNRWRSAESRLHRPAVIPAGRE